jgi:hypothetical protein
MTVIVDLDSLTISKKIMSLLRVLITLYKLSFLTAGFIKVLQRAARAIVHASECGSCAIIY